MAHKIWVDSRTGEAQQYGRASTLRLPIEDGPPVRSGRAYTFSLADQRINRITPGHFSTMVHIAPRFALSSRTSIYVFNGRCPP